MTYAHSQLTLGQPFDRLISKSSDTNPYLSSTVVSLPNDAENVLLEVSRFLGVPLTVDAPYARRKRARLSQRGGAR